MIPSSPPLTEMPSGDAGFLADVKERITHERIRAVLSANAAMVLLYWDIGHSILYRQEQEGWGAKVVDRLSHDLRASFPDMSGLSPRNLKYMRTFAAAWPDREIVQRTVAQIPWRSNLALLDKLEEPDLRLWYANKTLELGLSRDTLVVQIESGLHEREGQAQHNFPATLPPADSDMATQAFKDPYLFDFLGTADPRREAELEQKLIDHIQRFLLELGQGFAFVGRQVQIEVGEREFRLDLLFYHLKLRREQAVEILILVHGASRRFQIKARFRRRSHSYGKKSQRRAGIGGTCRAPGGVFQQPAMWSSNSRRDVSSRSMSVSSTCTSMLWTTS